MPQFAKLLKCAQFKPPKNPDPLCPVPSNLDIFLFFPSLLIACSTGACWWRCVWRRRRRGRADSRSRCSAYSRRARPHSYSQTRTTVRKHSTFFPEVLVYYSTHCVLQYKLCITVHTVYYSTNCVLQYKLCITVQTVYYSANCDTWLIVLQTFMQLISALIYKIRKMVKHRRLWKLREPYLAYWCVGLQ